MPDRAFWTAVWQDVARLPLQILAVGGAVIMLLLGLRQLGLPDLAPLGGGSVTWLQIIVALAMFAVGIAVVGFLWWLSGRFFALLGNDAANAEKVAALKDLPLGLPEGTVRAVLALVVAVIGLPLLLFSHRVGGNEAIAGYINGIITGVFGFYFGTRTSGIPAAAVNTIAEAQRTAQQQTDLAKVARAQTAAAEQREAQALQQVEQKAGVAGFDGALARAQRHLVLARMVIDTFKAAGALPPGLLPDRVDEIFRQADTVIGGLRGVTGENATPAQATALTQVLGALTGSASPLGALLGQAAPLLNGLVPALGPFGGLAMVLGVGVKLGSDQFKRWRARVLAAPLAQGLVVSGVLTPQLARAALERTPALLGLLAARPQAEVDAVLSNALGAEMGEQVLLDAYGPQGRVAPGTVPEDNAAALTAALQQGLLSVVGAGDIPEDRVTQVRETLLAAPALAQAAGGQPLFAPTAEESAALRAVTPAQVNAIIDNVSGLSARADGSAAAAFDALVTLVDTARREGVDLAQAIAELRR